MIAYGIATSFQVLSNLSNTSEMPLPEEDEGEEEGEEDKEEEEQEEKRKSICSLFDGGRQPPSKLTVNYLMEVRAVV